MAKMENISKGGRSDAEVLKNSLNFNTKTIKPEFEKLLHQLKKYQGNRLESRAFAYLDVISWLESKIYGLNVQDVIRQKYLKDKGKRVSDVVNTLTPVCFAVVLIIGFLQKVSPVSTSFNWFIVLNPIMALATAWLCSTYPIAFAELLRDG